MAIQTWWLLLLLVFSFAVAADGININDANTQEIADALPGIGDVKAKAIVAFRRSHGPFTSLQQLLEVKGIGPRTVDRIEPFVRFGEAAQIAIQINREQRHDQAVREAIREIVARARKGGQAVKSQP